MQEKIHKGHPYSGLQLGWRKRDTEEQETTRIPPELGEDAAPAHTKAGHQLHATPDILPHFPKEHELLPQDLLLPGVAAVDGLCCISDLTLLSRQGKLDSH